MQTPSVVEYSVDAQIDVFGTQAFAEIKSIRACEYAYTCNLGCHSRAHSKRDCNLTDCHLCFPVNPVDHHTTSTSAIVFEAAIPTASRRFPCLRVVT